MSEKSQKANMERLSGLLGGNLSYLFGENESGPNGDKKTFLNLGKTFLRAAAKDLGLRDVRVTSNAGGSGVSGSCTLYGMWEQNGIYLCLEQFCSGRNVLLYRSIRELNDHKGGYNHFLSAQELGSISYAEFLSRMKLIRKDASFDVRAA